MIERHFSRYLREEHVVVGGHVFTRQHDVTDYVEELEQRNDVTDDERSLVRRVLAMPLGTGAPMAERHAARRIFDRVVSSVASAAGAFRDTNREEF